MRKFKNLFTKWTAKENLRYNDNKTNFFQCIGSSQSFLEMSIWLNKSFLSQLLIRKCEIARCPCVRLGWQKKTWKLWEIRLFNYSKWRTISCMLSSASESRITFNNICRLLSVLEIFWNPFGFLIICADKYLNSNMSSNQFFLLLWKSNCLWWIIPSTVRECHKIFNTPIRLIWQKKTHLKESLRILRAAVTVLIIFQC